MRARMGCSEVTDREHQSQIKVEKDEDEKELRERPPTGQQHPTSQTYCQTADSMIARLQIDSHSQMSSYYVHQNRQESN